MYISLLNDFQVDRVKEKEAPSDRQLTENWIQSVVIKAYAAGISPDKRRIYNGIAVKMEKAVKDNSDFFEVNAVEYTFLKEAFGTASMDPKFTMPVTVVESAVLNAVAELPAKGK